MARACNRKNLYHFWMRSDLGAFCFRCARAAGPCFLQRFEHYFFLKMLARAVIVMKGQGPVTISFCWRARQLL